MRVLRLLASLLFLSSAAFAQTVTLTASNIRVGGSLLASGQLCVVPVDASNKPLAAAALGGSTPGAETYQTSCAAVTSGVLASSFSVPDTALSTPTNMCLRVTIADNNQNGRIIYTATCVQPASTGQPWCSTSGGVTTCNFDLYTPVLAAQAPITSPTLAVGTVSTVAPGSPATASVSGSSPHYLVNLGIPQGTAGLGSDPNCGADGSGNLVCKTVKTSVNGVINVAAPPYNAVNDGVTDNTAAIAAAVAALNAQGHGALYFPGGVGAGLGYYSPTCNFTITAKARVYGDGSGINDNQTTFGSALICGNAIGNGLNFTGNLAKVRDLAIYNTNASPTGAGVYINGTLTHQRGSLDNVYTWGWYDGVHENGAYWDIGGGSQSTNNVRAGYYVENTVVSDEGDWNIHNVSCNGGTKTNSSSTAGTSACVYITSAGGGKITSIKSNATLTHGIYLSCTACNTNQLLITGVDIENTTNAPIYMTSTTTYGSVTITGGYLGGPSTYPDIYLNNIINTGIVGVQMNTYGSTGSQPEAVHCASTITTPVMSSNVVELPQFTQLSTSCGQNIVDLNTHNKVTQLAHPVIIFGCSWTNCGSDVEVDLTEQGGTGVIDSSYSAGGVTIIVPRDGANFGGFQICASDGVTCNFKYNTSTSTLTLPNATFTGTVNINSGGALNIASGLTITPYTTTQSGSYTLQFTNGSYQRITTSNTLTMANPNQTANYGLAVLLEVCQGSTPYTVTYASQWYGAVAPTVANQCIRQFWVNQNYHMVPVGPAFDTTNGNASMGAPLSVSALTVATARRGTFTCTAGGTISVSNTNMTAGSDVVITMKTAGGTITTPPAFKTVTGGTGFSVLCGASDTSTYQYSILN